MAGRFPAKGWVLAEQTCIARGSPIQTKLACVEVPFPLGVLQDDGDAESLVLDGQDALYVASHSSRVGSSNRKCASDSRKAAAMHAKADQGEGLVSEILALQYLNKAVRIMTAIEQGRPSAPNRANSCSAASVCTT